MPAVLHKPTCTALAFSFTHAHILHIPAEEDLKVIIVRQLIITHDLCLILPLTYNDSDWLAIITDAYLVPSGSERC